eukprot:c20551_g1_i6.p1 GENE.c20551_g1_i6~~c20551_g1_i6.p1  ORF type:complete len:822 (+),score=113.08 c20551_g1_i6:368-2467(+)
MCSAMAAGHQKSKATRQHVVVIGGGGEATEPSSSSSPPEVVRGCEDHEGERFCAYDVQCGRLVCGVCLAVGSHRGHECKTVDQVVCEFRGEVEQLVAAGEAVVAKLRDQYQHAERCKAKADQIKVAAHAHIRALFDQLRQLLGSHEQALMKQIDQATKQRHFQLHDRQQCIGHLIACAEHSVSLGRSVVQGSVSTPIGVVATTHEVRAMIQHSQRAANRERFAVSASAPQSTSSSSQTQSQPPQSDGECGGWSARVNVLEGTTRRFSRLVAGCCSVVVVEENEDARDLARAAAKRKLEEAAELERQSKKARTEEGSSAPATAPDMRQEIQEIFESLQKGELDCGVAAQKIRRRLQRDATLKELRVPANNVSARALAHVLRTNTSLEALHLVGTMGDEGACDLANALLTNNSLRLLDLGGNTGDESARALAQALRKNTSLTSLEFRGSSMGNEGARALAVGLRANKSLKSLCLFMNNVEDEGARVLADVIRTNTSLTSLYFCNNRVVGLALANALRTNTSLTSLDIEYSYMGDDVACMLADVLRTNASLTSLNLGWNRVEAAGARSLADALRTNKSLKSLNLRNGTLGDEGARALANGLLTNTSLTLLDLRKNYIAGPGARALAELLSAGTSLTSLNLEDNTVGEEGGRALANGLCENTSIMSLNIRSEYFTLSLFFVIESMSFLLFAPSHNGLLFQIMA